MSLPRNSWPLTDEQAADLIDVLAAAGDRRAAAEIYHAFDRRVADPKQKALALQAYERALWSPAKTEASEETPARWPLVGRATELDRTCSMLERDRIVQLVGPGGIGKSRLASEAARLYAEASGADTAWVRTADGMRAGELSAAAARALRFPESAADLDAFCESVSDMAPLLIVDSCENAADAVEAFVRRVRERSAAVRVLLTSRRTLPVSEKNAIVEVGPLSAKHASPSEPAVRLFVERAMSANPQFAMTPENAGDVLAICEFLNGVPLAIEVAAGYLAHVGVGELSERVRDGRSADLAGIVAHTLSWRLELLPQTDRELLLHLSIFDGDFSLADAQAIAGDSCEDALERLSSAFLVLREPAPNTVRFRLLDPVRAFARSRVTPEDARRLRALFVAYAAGLGTVPAQRIAQLAPTFLAALRFATADPAQTCAGVRIAANAGVELGLAGFAAAALPAVENLVTREPAASCDAYDGALGAWSWLLSRRGNPAKAVEINEVRIERARQSMNDVRICDALATSIVAARNVGEFERAKAYGEEALVLAPRIGDTRSLGKALRGLASVLMLQGDVQRAAQLFERLFELDERAVGSTEYTMSLHDYATALRELGRRAEAAPLLRRCIDRAMNAGDYASAIHAHATLARLSSDAGRMEEAHALLRDAMHLSRNDVNPLTRMYAFEDLVAASMREGQYETLAALLGHVDRTRERAGFKAGSAQREYIASIRSAVRSHLSPRDYDEAYARGRISTLDEAFAQLEALLPGSVRLDSAERLAPLSAREREVALLASQGRTNREIAAGLGVSVRTVDAHMATIFRKLGIDKREDIIR